MGHYFVGVVDLSVELGDLLLVHEEQVGLVVVALDGRRGVRILHLLALHLGTYTCMYVCMYVCMYSFMCLCIYCVYVCMYVCMYV